MSLKPVVAGSFHYIPKIIEPQAEVQERMNVKNITREKEKAHTLGYYHPRCYKSFVVLSFNLHRFYQIQTYTYSICK